MSPDPKRLALTIARWALRIIAAALLAVSLLSVIEANEWWIRIWDFPRLQILVAILLVMVALAFLERRARIWLLVPLAIAAAWQLYRIYPYTPLAATEVAFSDAVSLPEDQCFSIVSFNVLQSNRDYDRTLAMLGRTDPDILLLLETDAGWKAALEPILSQYPSRLDRPLDNTYGLIFATRLPMADARIEDIAEADTPSVTARLTAGAPFRLIGLHPRPPHPGQDTEERARRSPSPQPAPRAMRCRCSPSVISTTWHGRTRRICSNGSGGIWTPESGAAPLRLSRRTSPGSPGRWTICSSRRNSPCGRCA